MTHDPAAIAELARMGNPQLCERLRGTYRIPVNDGAGLLNGSDEFVRQFETGAIQHEAARRIEALLAKMAKLISMGRFEEATDLLS